MRQSGVGVAGYAVNNPDAVRTSSTLAATSEARPAWPAWPACLQPLRPQQSGTGTRSIREGSLAVLSMRVAIAHRF
jgi:hypothetical protein